MKQLIRRWLGLDVITWHLEDIRNNRLDDRRLLNRLDRNLLDVIAPAMVRVAAKLDAQYTRSEFDPQRIAESKALEEEVIKRLNAEAMARAPYNLPEQR